MLNLKSIILERWDFLQTVAIGVQDFEAIRTNHYFYIDKTDFIRQWWESGDSVTLLARPRRFGKTLTMDMLNKFFSIDYADRGDLFDGLNIWKADKYRNLQGTWPVLFLSFANVKETTCEEAKKSINQILTSLYIRYSFLAESGILKEKEKEFFDSVSWDMDEPTASIALHNLCGFLYRYYGKKVIVLLDEYDTPMQEAYVNDYWMEFTAFIRNIFNSTFKTNPYLERALMTGITRVSKESVFSDLNNLNVITITSEEYADCFGFTEEEVFSVMDARGLSDQKQAVKDWYDGFTFGNARDIYNPWSIINFLSKKKLAAYWANTSSNSLVAKLIREGDEDIKQDFQILLDGGAIETSLDEQIIYNQLSENPSAIWSLLLASGYLTPEKKEFHPEFEWDRYTLRLTNHEVVLMFRRMVRQWFSRSAGAYNRFINAMLRGDIKEMNAYMNRITVETFSFFDSGIKPSDKVQPERFYHGFVLGLLVELRERYCLTSNRESGLGRYDVMLEPLQADDDAFILEFKVLDPDEEKSLEDTVLSALRQIRQKNYAAALTAKGIPENKIRCYGFAFQGKNVLIG